MINVTSALAQIEKKTTELQQVKQLLQQTEPARFLDLFYDCKKQGIKLYHYLEDNRELLRSIKDYLNHVFFETDFSFSMQEMTLNSDKLIAEHKELGTIGELYLSKKRLFAWKSPFNHLLTNQKLFDFLDKQIPLDEEQLNSEEKEVARIEKLPGFLKKGKGYTPVKLEQAKKTIEQKKQQIIKQKAEKEALVAQEESLWNTFIQHSFAFKDFILQMETFGFTHNFYAFEPKKTYYMQYREQINHHLSGVLTYEEGHISLLHDKEWERSTLNEPNLKSFSFTEAEFHYLYEQIQVHFPQASREKIDGNDLLSIKTENGSFHLAKEGLILIHGEDLNLYHLLRFPPIRKALCLLYKERTHDDHLKAIQRL